MKRYLKVVPLNSRLVTAIIVIAVVMLDMSKKSKATVSILSMESGNSTLLVIRDKTLVPADVPIQGFLVVARSTDSCQPQPPPMMRHRQPTTHWILLVNLDKMCSIASKAENARLAGYSALLVRNVGSNDTGHWMPHTKYSDTPIYTGVVGENDGNLLASNFAFPNKYIIQLSGVTSWKIAYYFMFYCSLFIAVVFFCWFLRMIIFNSYLPRFHPELVERYNNAWQMLSRRCASYRLQKLPVEKWVQEEKGPIEICAICLEDLVTEDRVRVLCCSHVFHMSCIDTWIICERHHCPICITDVFRVPKQGAFRGFVSNVQTILTFRWLHDDALLLPSSQNSQS